MEELVDCFGSKGDARERIKRFKAGGADAADSDCDEESEPLTESQEEIISEFVNSDITITDLEVQIQSNKKNGVLRSVGWRRGPQPRRLE